MDPGRDRSRPVGLRHRFPGGPGAGRRPGRCAPVGANRRGRRRLADRRQRARLRDLADLPGRADGFDPACRRELRAGSGDRRDQPRPRGLRRHRRTVRAQRAFCLHWRGPLRRGDGRLRLFILSPGGLFRHRGAPHPRPAGAARHILGGNRSRAGARQDVRTTGRHVARGSLEPPRQAASAGVRRFHPAVPPGQRRHASAHGERAHHAPGQMGHDPDRGLHRGAAAHRGPVLAVGRPSRPSAGDAGHC